MTFPKLRFLLLLLNSFGLLLSPLLSFADDYSSNIGFMKNTPKELKEKFPMSANKGGSGSDLVVDYGNGNDTLFGGGGDDLIACADNYAVVAERRVA